MQEIDRRFVVRARACALSFIVGIAGFSGAGCDAAEEPSPVCMLSVSPSVLTPCVRAGSLTATVMATGQCRWSAATNAAWLSVVAGASGDGLGTITVAHTDNYDSPREGFVTLKAESTPEVSIRVSQAGCRYGVTRSEFTFNRQGGTGTFDVTQQTDPYECGGPKQDACQWTSTATEPWIVITTSTPQIGDGRVTFTVGPSTSGQTRTAAIVVRDRIVQITQTGQ